MRWLVADSLSCPEQWFGSHLSAYSHYLREAGEVVDSYCMNLDVPEETVHEGDALRRPDVIFALDRYDRCARWSFDLTTATQKTVKMIAQVAAITNPLPWNVRRADGSPVYDLIISSIPDLVEQARAAGARAEYQPLAFDLRCRTAIMGVKRERKAIFLGTRSPNHRRREEWLTELADIVEIVPPAFGRQMFAALASARVVLNVHAEWARGAANTMRLFESAGMGCAVISDGDRVDVPEWPRPFHQPVDNVTEARKWIGRLLDGDDRDIEIDAAEVLLNHTYERRMPRLIEWARSL